MESAIEIFNRYLKKNGLKLTRQRQVILDFLMKSDKHITAEQLYRAIEKKHPNIGLSTVYRTLKLLSDCGLARTLRLDENITSFEASYRKKHHDHIICRECGHVVEFYSEKIKTLQIEIAKKYGFIPEDHRIKIIGLCPRCAKKKGIR
ncbi:MAG: transcriptional repressor [Candidatus Eremiobacteraeota bacterium]|nr:transcriptional repressor [Candidatus Eremiobacteraeota bacterium]